MTNIFSLLAAIISIYTILCFIRVVLTWFPGAEYSGFGRVLSQLCDPYLNIFRRFTFLRFSSFDFTPAIALCVLMAVQTLLSSLSFGHGFRLSELLAMLVMLIGNIFSSVFGFIALILLIRLFVYLFIGDGSSTYSIWTAVDRAISPIIFKIAGLFSRNRPVSFLRALVISLITVVAFSLLFSYAIRTLGFLIAMIPV